MILGYASFGHKGVIFPLLVRAIGVVGSIISTYSVKAGPESTSDEALHSVHPGFILGSIISLLRLFRLRPGYPHLYDPHVKEYPQAVGGYRLTEQFETDRTAFEQQQVGANKSTEEKAAEFRAWVRSYPNPILSSSQPLWSNFGFGGLDMRPAWTCLIGIIL